MIAKLFNAPTDADANTIGTSTIGSSEAIMVSTYSGMNLELLNWHGIAGCVGTEEALAKQAQGWGQALRQAKHDHEFSRAGLLGGI
jgi:hypothetical protein